jgi:hypothetical protein
MTHEHRFRAAMQPAIAFSVLREHAGSQWDAQVIDHVIAVFPTMAAMAGLTEVGRAEDASERARFDVNAIDAEDVNELLLAVDAEI